MKTNDAGFAHQCAHEATPDPRWLLPARLAFVTMGVTWVYERCAECRRVFRRQEP